MNPTETNRPRSKTKRNLLIGTALLSGVLISGVAVAHGGAGGFQRGGPGFGGMHLMRMVHGLELTEQQEIKLVKSRRAMKEQAKQLRAEMQQVMDAALAELEKPTPDAQKIHALADQASAKMNGMMHKGIDEFLSFHQTMTPEQRKQLVDRAREMKTHRENKMHERRGRRGGKE